MRLKMLGVPPAVGKRHSQLQTDIFLEEISESVVHIESVTQTDTLLDRPQTPHYIPAKIGKDVNTQIHDGELFVFDVEVKPIVEIIVGKVCDQALIELIHEEEMATIWAQQLHYQELRNAEMAEQQRLVEQEKRRLSEIERRYQQEEKIAGEQLMLKKRAAADTLARSMITRAVPDVFQSLQESGFMPCEVEDDLSAKCFPQLCDSLDDKQLNSDIAEQILNNILQDLVLDNVSKFPKTPKEQDVEETEVYEDEG